MPPALPRASEDWPQEVVCYETDDEIVLIDPFLPQDRSFARQNGADPPHAGSTPSRHRRDGRAVRRISLDTAAAD